MFRYAVIKDSYQKIWEEEDFFFPLYQSKHYFWASDDDGEMKLTKSGGIGFWRAVSHKWLKNSTYKNALLQKK